jgi:hypothetical protein
MKLIKALTLSITLGFAASGAYAKSKNDAALKSAFVEFSAGSAKLTAADKNKLRQLVREGLTMGDIDHVTVAAWADKPLPAPRQSHNATDRGLADERLELIKDFLKTETEVYDVDTYSMAESANWLARTFNTREAELKSIFGRTDTDAPIRRSEFRVIRELGAPSRAVVVVVQDVK